MSDDKKEELSLDTEIIDIVLTLKSSDSEKYEISKKVAIQSELIKTITDGDSKETEIPLPNVKGNVLQKVLEFLNYHSGNPAKEIEKPLKSANMKENVSEWDAEYVNVGDELLFDLLLAANYMDVKPLLDLTCAKVASEMKGRSVEEIRKRFNIVNDLTEEEIAAIKLENKWAEES